MELASGILFPFLYWHYGLHLELLFVLVYTAIFLVVFVVDLEHELILDKVVFPSLVLALAFSPFRSSPTIQEALIGGAAAFTIMLLAYLVFRGGFGMGDVKLAPFLGIITGFPWVIVALMLSVVGGGMVALFLLATGLKKRKEAIPFGPFLVCGTLVTVLWGGQAIWDSYVDLLEKLLP